MSVAHVLGYPRIGAKRELKFALEKYWRGELSENDLQAVAAALRKSHWQAQKDAGLDYVTVGDFSFYDQVLDTTQWLGALPERCIDQGSSALDNYFRAARGAAPTGKATTASELTKWFDTNYHYLVPELHADQSFHLQAEQLLGQINEALAQGHKVKPVILGPISYLYLAKTTDNSDKLALLGKLIPVYRQLLQAIEQTGCKWIQIDEPALVFELDNRWQEAFRITYKHLQDYQIRILLATYFDRVDHHLPLLQSVAVDGLHVDAVRGADTVQQIIDAWPKERVLSLGVIDGRNIWRNDLRASLQVLKTAQQKFNGRLWVSASSSLQHVPVDLTHEQKLPSEQRQWLAFARQKLDEIVTLSRALAEGVEAVESQLSESDQVIASRRHSPQTHRAAVRARHAAVNENDAKRHLPYNKRAALQRAALELPAFPTTTIGSFPQTPEIRALRAGWKKGQISEQEYRQGIRAQIADHIQRQEALGLDVLVHGEAERNDMVEYFGEQLEGFLFTENGWVQSYGSRCVKPPVIFGDVERKASITVDWAVYAQSLTEKPVKGMLTGPVTILCWSFNRDDLSRQAQCEQIALALRDEVRDLEKAGITIIQIDEPAIREGLPLRKGEQGAYLDWAVNAFKLATSGVADTTQIHTHMCYSEFNEIIDSIAALDADVITIETSRSHMELLQAFRDFAYPNEIGPGVYDIHSPVVPTTEQIEVLLEKALQHIPQERLWVNPDCGLKTRAWPETERALQAMVQAAKRLRAKHQPAAVA